VAGLTRRCYIIVSLHPGLPLRPLRFLRRKDALRTVSDLVWKEFSALISKPVTYREFMAVSLHDGDCCRCRRYEPWVALFPASSFIMWCDCDFDIYGLALDPSNLPQAFASESDPDDIPF
jgi:hypothetical protein